MQHLLPVRLIKSLSATSLPGTTSTLHELASTHPKGVARVVLKKGKTQLFKDGSPMVYSGAVDRIIGRPPPRTGDIVLVADGAEKPIGWGMYNSVSMFSVRLMQLEEEATRLSGLIVDIFGDVAVVASSAAWVEKYKAEVEACINRIGEVNFVNWRPSLEVLKEEGLDVSNYKERDPSFCPQRTKVMENGIFYSISLEGQKTGFYADQRENRQFISTISDGQKVLDMFCYSGGFALNAARGGAANVIGVDSSLPAIELAKENVVLNNMDPQRITFLKEDASEFMKGALSRNESWDIVILDPPKLAPRKKVLQNASGMYRNLNSLAMQLTKRGGLLMTCSCSGAMTQSGMFLRILQGAASAAGRKITVLRDAGAACDHPIDPSYPEGKYLSNVLLRVL
ncbi:uncharacterized protein [Malus domestica]|uniref:uncharacterized protein isoform X2 n=1 Tax=Malus domestica TaxID=3750 RepID=UPI0010AAB732|nr:uncharacterized protein LOC103445929 isoform X2 [Malus domestica]